MSFGFDPSIILSATRTQEPTPNETLRTLADLAGMRQQQQAGQARLADLLRGQQREQRLSDLYRQNAGNQEAVAPALMREGFGKEALSWLSEQAQIAARQRQNVPTAEEKEYMSARAAYLRNPPRKTPKPVDSERQEALRLSNEKKRMDLERAKGSGGPNRLLALDGYELDPSFDLKPEVAEKIREAQSQTKLMIKNADEMMALYRKHGNKVLPGKERAQMESLARNLQLLAKGPAGYELGVIAGPDMDLLNSVIPVSTSKQATIADFFTGGGDVSETMERLRVFRDQIGSKFDAKVTARGYRRKGKAAPKLKAAAKGLSADEAEELERLKAELGDEP